MNNATVNAVMAESASNFSAEMFTADSLLSECGTLVKAKDGTEVMEYSLRLKGKGETEDCTITDSAAIAAIKGIQAADKLEKYAAYRKGGFLVQLVDSRFMRDNEIKSVSQLAANYELGVETSTSNALENVARRLGVSFDENGNLHFADDSLPKLSFWHYSQIISLVTEDSAGAYNYDSLKDFLTAANVSPIMSQKRLKELFNDYRNGRLESKVALPDSVTEKAKKDAERVEKAEKERQKAEEAKRIVSASVALEKAESFTDKQDVALSALKALVDCLRVLGINADENESIDNLRLSIVSAEPPKAEVIEKKAEN